MAEFRLTAADAGAAVPAGPGDRVVIELAENASTGYQWSISVTGAGELVGDTREVPAAPAPGAAVTRRFTVQVTGAGGVRISARSRRPWEAESLAADTVEFTVGGG